MKYRKTKTAIFIIISITLIGFFTRPGDNVKYRILNEIIADDNLSIYRLCNEFTELPIYEEGMNGFSWYDQLTIYSQTMTQFNLRIKPNKLKFIPNNSETKEGELIKLTENCNKGFQTRISMPIISFNKKMVLLKIIEDCNCNLGGQEETVLYEKENGIWKRKGRFDHFISFKS